MSPEPTEESQRHEERHCQTLGCVMQEEALAVKASCQKCEPEPIRPLDVTARLLFTYFHFYHINYQIIMEDFRLLVSLNSHSQACEVGAYVSGCLSV